MPLEMKNVEKSTETLKFVAEMEKKFGLIYETDYRLTYHLTEAKRMTGKQKGAWKIAYQLPNAIRFDNGDQSGTFLVFSKEITEPEFMDVLKFVAEYLNTTYEKYL
ncbi:hypothetical protein ABEX78_20945 [Priestia megaterium]